MFYRVVNIWYKELIDVIRNPKALQQSLVVPIVIGLVFALITPVMGQALADQSTGEELSNFVVPVVGLSFADEAFVNTLAAQNIRLQAYEDDIKTAVENNMHPFGMIIEEGFNEALAVRQPANLTILFNTQSQDNEIQAQISRLNAAVLAYNSQVLHERVEGLGISTAILTPVQITHEQFSISPLVASTAVFLPVLVVVISVMGGAFIAIDVTAGEKERGTLESLLITPTSNHELFLGKWMAVITMSGIPLILTFAAFVVTTNIVSDKGVIISPLMLTGALLASIPFVLAITVILMIIAIRTKTFKDAQSSLTPLFLGTMLPAMAASFFSPTAPWMYLIPAYGSAAVVNNLVINDQIVWLDLGLSSLGCFILMGLGIMYALQIFDREWLLYSM